VIGSLSPVLASTETLHRLRARVAALPAFTKGGFECRLDISEDEPDLGFVTSAADGGQALLDAWGQSPLAPLCKAWLKWHELRDVGIEMDAPNWSLSGVFATFRAGAGDAPVDRAFAVGRLLGIDGNGLEQGVQELASRLPTGVLMQTFGFMLGRSPAFVRLNLGGAVSDCLEQTLDAIAWPGNREPALSLLKRLRPHLSFCVVCLDFATMLSPRLGLECFFRSLDDVLKVLVSVGLCLPEKADALLTWPQPYRALDSHPLLEWLGAAVCARVNHVKIDITPDGVALKAYPIYRCVYGERRVFA
jgi:hypothetical protein